MRGIMRARPWSAALAPVLAGALLTIAAPAASADEWYNDYVVTGLPEFVTASTPFSVTVDGPDAVCGMTFGDASLTAAPWDFVWVDPGLRGRGAGEVAVDLCDGGGDYVRLEATVPFGFGTTIISADAGGSNLHGTELELENRTSAPATVTVANAKGRTVATGSIGPTRRSAATSATPPASGCPPRASVPRRRSP